MTGRRQRRWLVTDVEEIAVCANWVKLRVGIPLAPSQGQFRTPDVCLRTQKYVLHNPEICLTVSRSLVLQNPEICLRKPRSLSYRTQKSTLENLDVSLLQSPEIYHTGPRCLSYTAQKFLLQDP